MLNLDCFKIIGSIIKCSVTESTMVEDTMVENIMTENTICIADILSGTEAVSNIIVNIIVIVGGILGFNYIKTMREKQIDSTFSYLTRLNVRLKYFHELLVIYKDEIMDRFVPQGYRREISPDRVQLVENTIKQLSESAKETLSFIMDEDNQIPAQKGWVSKFNLFIEFLIDCEQLEENIYFKWSVQEDLEVQKEQYYENVLYNIEELLRMVNDRQIKLENQIFKND